MSAPVYAAVRYLVTWLCGYLVLRGWTIANLDGATMDAVAQIIIGVGGAVAMATVGVLKSRVSSLIARLQERHKPELLKGAADVPGVEKILTTPALADATPSDKVVSSIGAAPVRS